MWLGDASADLPPPPPSPPPSCPIASAVISLRGGTADDLSFIGFCSACRAMGYGGNLKELWIQLDKESTGRVTMSHVDAEIADAVGKFKTACIDKYGDMLHAWRSVAHGKGLGVDRNERHGIDEAHPGTHLRTGCAPESCFRDTRDTRRAAEKCSCGALLSAGCAAGQTLQTYFWIART